MSTEEVKFHSPKETMDFAKKFASKCVSGTVIALIGQLGSGKTTFAKGFAKGLKIQQTVGSPTFKLVSEYQGIQTVLYHIDCYRLQSLKDFLNIGGEDYLFLDNGITVIEWAEKIMPILPDKTIVINFRRIQGKSDGRMIKITLNR
jgi:tRNA threonylcarbamoyladenosine biosynthesis protein TsaE